jgi:hypothetical protein
MMNKEYTEEEILAIILKWPLKKLTSFVEKAKRGPSGAFELSCREKGLTDISSSESRSGNQIIVTASYKPPFYLTRTFNRNVTCRIELCMHHKVSQLHTYLIKKFDDLDDALVFADNINNLKEQAEALLKPFGYKLKAEQNAGSIFEIDIDGSNIPNSCAEAYIMYLEQAWHIGMRFNKIEEYPSYLWQFDVPLKVTKDDIGYRVSLVTLTKQKDWTYLIEDDLCNPDPNKIVCVKLGFSKIVDIENKKIGHAYVYSHGPERGWVIWQDCPENQIEMVTKLALEGKK